MRRSVRKVVARTKADCVTGSRVGIQLTARSCSPDRTAGIGITYRVRYGLLRITLVRVHRCDIERREIRVLRRDDLCETDAVDLPGDRTSRIECVGSVGHADHIFAVARRTQASALSDRTEHVLTYREVRRSKSRKSDSTELLRIAEAHRRVATEIVHAQGPLVTLFGVRARGGHYVDRSRTNVCRHSSWRRMTVLWPTCLRIRIGRAVDGRRRHRSYEVIQRYPLRSSGSTPAEACPAEGRKSEC